MILLYIQNYIVDSTLYFVIYYNFVFEQNEKIKFVKLKR